MRRLCLLLACLASACDAPTAPACADRTIVVDTIGWVLRSPTDTAGPITTTGPRCIKFRLGE